MCEYVYICVCMPVSVGGVIVVTWPGDISDYRIFISLQMIKVWIPRTHIHVKQVT